MTSIENSYFYSKFNYKPVTEFLNKKSEEFKDLSFLMKSARVFLKNVINKNFETSGTHSGEKWQEWSDGYKKWRLAQGRTGSQILSLEGDLRRDLRAKSDSMSAAVGFNKDYAAIHNFGGNSSLKRNKTMPKREFMRLSDYDKEELLAELYMAAEEMLMQDIGGVQK